MSFKNTAKPTLDHFEKGILFAGIAILTALFAVFYPPYYGFRDEGIYLGMADALLHGKLFISPLEYPISITVEALGRHAPFYPLGNSVLLMPFLYWGWKAVFLMGLAAHLCAFFLFRKFSREFDSENLPTLLLFLFFPSFLFYSRTVMSDIPSLVCFLGAYVFYFSKKKRLAAAGMVFGISLFFRVANVVMIAPFVVAQIWDAVQTKKGKGMTHFLLALAPFVIAAAAYNQFVYGAPWHTGYSKEFTGVDSFELTFFWPNLKHYLLSLNLVYPGMFLLFLADRRMRRFEILGLLIFNFLFFGFYYFHDTFPGKIPTLVFGNRFFFPWVPFAILSYGKAADNLLNKLQAFRKPILLAGFFLFSASAVSIHWAHARALELQAKAVKLIYETTPPESVLFYDVQSSELMQRFLGKREYRPFNLVDEKVNSVNEQSRMTDIYIVISIYPSGVTTEIPEIVRSRFTLQVAGKTETLIIYRLTPKP